MNKNKLKLNTGKTNYLLIHNKKQSYNINLKINNKEIQCLNTIKYLGVVIDHRLSWKPHIEYIRNKVSKCMWAITKLRRYTNIKSLKLVYYSLAHPHLTYCISTWGSSPESSLKPLVVKQKRLIRIMLYQPFRCHTKPLFHQLQILNLNQLHHFQVGKIMHNYHKKKTNLNVNLELLTNKHSHNTRSAADSNYFLPNLRTNLGMNSLSSIGPQVWNSIPTNIKSLPAHLFKNKYKQYMLDSNML